MCPSAGNRPPQEREKSQIPGSMPGGRRGGGGGVMVTGQIEPFLKHCLKQCLFSSISRQYCCNARESNFGFCVFSAW